MRLLSFVFLSLTVLAIALVPSRGASVESFEFKQQQDTALLPYRVSELHRIPRSPDARPTNAMALLLQPRYSDSEKVYYLGMNMPNRYGEQATNIDVYSFPPPRLELLALVSLTPLQWLVHTDSVTGTQTAVITGFHGDSAFVIGYDPATAEYQRLLLQTDVVADEFGRRNVEIDIPLIADYDFDGILETFVQVKPVRGIGARTLYCVELKSMTKEWSIPMSLDFYLNRNMYRLPDTADPGIVFLSKGSWQGNVDANWDEFFGYVSIIDTAGNVRFNRIVQQAPMAPRLIANRDRSRLYFVHEFDPVHPRYTDSLLEEMEAGTISDGTARLTAIDAKGTILHSVQLNEYAKNLWLAPWRDKHTSCVYVYTDDRRVHVYDTSLSLLARSQPLHSNPGGFFGSIDVDGYPGVLLFGDGIYSRDFEQLANFGRACTPLPMTFDSSGNVVELLLSTSNVARFVSIERRTWTDMLAILYFRYRLYIMMGMTALVVGLLLVNYNRLRTKKNLAIIRRQKQELEEAQEALRRAQAQLVAQEKFRQAKDIAGGFAHEIRNALSPVRSGLTRLAALATRDPSPGEVEKLHRLMSRSVQRAHELTGRIGEYTQLDKLDRQASAAVQPAVDRVIDRYEDRMKAQSVIFRRRDCDDPEVKVRLPDAHLELLISNLVANALDALDGQAEPMLTISCEVTSDSVILSVTDSGPGIPEADRERIFDLFYSTKPDSGSGLGLTMVRKIVDLTGSTIEVQSDLSDGTRVAVKMPRG